MALFLSMALLVQPAVQAPVNTASAHLESALDRSHDNRPQLVQALARIQPEYREGMEFLIVHMPDQDLQSLTAEFLLEHVEFAYRAWNESKWKNEIPKDIFLNNLLPYASVDEHRDAWRKDFFERCGSLVAEAKTTSEAAAILNQKIFSMFNVRYSKQRRKANQSPYESIESTTASCTGLSVLLIDACRSAGVPARFVGTPLWSDKSGNHSWVEIWDDGWHFTGAAEPTGSELDKAWFVGRASKAISDNPRHAIYAVSFKPTPLHFPMVWNRRDQTVFAVNVTDRYSQGQRILPPASVEAMFRVLNKPGGERVAASIRVSDEAGTVLFQGNTKDERFDGNDHIIAVLPKGKTYRLEFKFEDLRWARSVEVVDDQPLSTFYLSDIRKK